MRLDVEFDSVDAIRTLDRAADAVEREIMDALEAGGDQLAEAFSSADHRDLAKDTWTVDRRDEEKTVAIGPAKSGKRAHIVRFWEWGTASLPAEGMMRRTVDSQTKKIVKAVERRLKRAFR